MVEQGPDPGLGDGRAYTAPGSILLPPVHCTAELPCGPAPEAGSPSQPLPSFHLSSSFPTSGHGTTFSPDWSPPPRLLPSPPPPSPPTGRPCPVLPSTTPESTPFPASPLSLSQPCPQELTSGQPPDCSSRLRGDPLHPSPTQGPERSSRDRVLSFPALLGLFPWLPLALRGKAKMPLHDLPGPPRVPDAVFRHTPVPRSPEMEAFIARSQHTTLFAAFISAFLSS